MATNTSAVRNRNQLIVAIHQPNYLPWIGYFQKIAASDVFIFLNDVQFPKNGFCNRVKVLGDGRERWLTVPVSKRFGDTIDQTRPATGDWPERHLDALKNYYRKSSHYHAAWPRLVEIFAGIPNSSLADSNQYLIEAMCSELGLKCRFLKSSEIPVEAKTGDDRLIALVASVALEATYLSGTGARNYQNEDKFTAAGLGIRYNDQPHPNYEQDQDQFVAGLSIIDAVLHLGWQEAAELLDRRS